MVARLVSADSNTGKLPDVVLADLATRHVVKNELVYNVRDFGAKGNGSTDDTDAIQACIDAAIGGTPSGAIGPRRVAKADVFFPVGVYRISRPIRVYGVRGLRIYGGGFGTELVATTNMYAIFDLNGFAFGALEYFYLRGATADIEVPHPVKIDWDQAVSTSSTSSITMRKIRVSDVKYVHAFAAGVNSGAFDVSQVSFYDCFAAGKWAAGETTWYQGGFTAGSGVNGNVLNMWYYSCTSVYNRYAFFCNTTTMFVYSSSPGFSEVDYYQVGARPMLVDGFRSENSQRLFAQAGGASFATSADISNGIFTTGMLATDEFWIKQLYGGTVSLRNVAAQPTSGKKPRIQVGAARGGLLTAYGVASMTPLAERFTTSGTGSIVDINAIVLTDQNQVSTSRALWAKQTGAASQSQLPTFGDGLSSGGPVVFPSYASSARPAASGLADGATIFDSTLGRLISVRGGAWVDQSGATV